MRPLLCRLSYLASAGLSRPSSPKTVGEPLVWGQRTVRLPEAPDPLALALGLGLALGFGFARIVGSMAMSPERTLQRRTPAWSGDRAAAKRGSFDRVLLTVEGLYRFSSAAMSLRGRGPRRRRRAWQSARQVRGVRVVMREL
jgi:hypothetical protein